MSVIPIYEYDGERIGKAYDDAPELIHKSAEVRTIYSGNVVDTTGKTAPSTSLDGSIHFDLPKGDYFSNPFVTDTGKSIIISPKDNDGNAIYMTKGGVGTRHSNIEVSALYIWKLSIDGLNISVAVYNSFPSFAIDDRSLSNNYVLDAEPAYWTFGGNGYTQGDSIERGFTQGTYSETYVAYAAPTTSYSYTEELNDHIEGFTDSVENLMMEPSMNLLDYSKIIWTASGGYYYLQKDYYMPVTAGTTIETNNTQGYFSFFDSAYTQVGSVGFSTPYFAVTVPTGAVWARVIFSSSYVSEGDPLMVWVARSATSAKYERPIYRPDIQFDQKFADGSMFDYAVPQNLTQGVVRYARFAALRAANERQSAYRFGTYNTFVSRGDNGFYLLREMAFDYALDFLGMQECAYPGSTVQAAMYPWQFPYDTGTVTVTGGTNIPVPAVSRFVITGTEDIELKESRHCLKISINLPQNKHYPRVPTLSVYNYHGSLNVSNRLAEIQTMLDVIDEDTADFIIIMGDTNSEVDQQGHRQSWDMWEAAGFTAVHHGESPTWPSQVNPSHYSSMDNIFVSSHINVLGYNIVPWQDYMLPNNLPLSDHDMVYADLQFDFDAVLKDTWEEPPTVS